MWSVRAPERADGGPDRKTSGDPRITELPKWVRFGFVFWLGIGWIFIFRAVFEKLAVKNWVRFVKMPFRGKESSGSGDGGVC